MASQQNFWHEGYLEHRDGAINSALLTVGAGLGRLVLHYVKVPDDINIADWVVIGGGAVRTAFMAVGAQSFKRIEDTEPSPNSIQAPHKSLWS